MIHKPSRESLNVPQKIWARSVQPLLRLLDTNKQTNKQTDKPNLYIDIVETNLYIMPNPTYLSLLPISEVVQVDLYFIEINKNIG